MARDDTPEDDPAAGAPHDGAPADAPRDGARGPTGRDALDPRRRILAATIELIGEAGWGRVTTRRVAERAGVNNALLHYYFGSKQALLVQAATEALVGAFADPVELLATAPTLADGAAHALRWLARVGPDLPNARTFVEISVQAARDPALRETFGTMLRQARADLAARARREGADPARAAGLAVAVLALLDGLLLHRLIDDQLDVEGVLEALAPLFEEATP